MLEGESPIQPQPCGWPRAVHVIFTGSYTAPRLTSWKRVLAPAVVFAAAEQEAPVGEQETRGRKMREARTPPGSEPTSRHLPLA